MRHLVGEGGESESYQHTITTTSQQLFAEIYSHVIEWICCTQKATIYQLCVQRW